MLGENYLKVLTIDVNAIEHIDSRSKASINREYRYRFFIDGVDYGDKSVEGVTRDLFINKVFEIAAELGQDTNGIGIGDKIKQLGESMYRLILPDRLQQFLSNMDSKKEGEALSIRTSDHDLPWELLCDSAGFLCHRIAMGREVPRANVVDDFGDPLTINICLIGDPTGELPAARHEIGELKRLFNDVINKLEH